MIKEIFLLSTILFLVFSFHNNVFAASDLTSYLDSKGAVKIKDNGKIARTTQSAEDMSDEEKENALIEKQVLAIVSVSEDDASNDNIDALTQTIENSSSLITSISYDKSESNNVIIFVYGHQDDKDSVLSEIEKSKTKDVIKVSENKKYTTSALPNDTLASSQYALTKIDYDTLYGTYAPGNNPVIAIIDSGVDTTDQDLENQLWVNTGEIANNSVDDDANGYIDDYHGCNMHMKWINGYNFIPCLDENLTDGLGNDAKHGSYVAQVAAADTNNAYGIAGICPECRIMILDVSDDSTGTITDEAIYYALSYAAFYNVDAVNMSLGSTCPYDASADVLAPTIDELINTKNIPLIQSAGNTGSRSLAECTYYCGSNPYCSTSARYQSYYYISGKTVDNKIVVGSTNSSDSRSSFSSFSYTDEVNIAAPGTDILMSDGSYHSGTSFSAPMVSGAVGVIKGKNSSLLPSEIVTKLRSFADIISTDHAISGKRLNLNKLFYNGMSYEGIGFYITKPPNNNDHLPVYRFRDLTTKGHFYTANEAEKDKVINTLQHLFTYEGTVFYVAKPPNTTDHFPVYRFKDLSSKGHFYTANEAEKDKVLNTLQHLFTYEGIGFYVAKPPNNADHLPVYRFRNLTVGGHFYTANEAEKDKLLNN